MTSVISRVRRAPYFLPIVVIAFLMTLRVVEIFHHSFDSDEGQHLHMVYGWAAGELPYRDRFDNHTPLLYLLYLPLPWLAGETPHIVEIARVAIFPISAAMLLLVFLIARRLADSEIALWTVAMSLALADWSMKSLEFRPDVLWAALWFLALWFLARRPERPTSAAFFLAGLSLGAALAASIKTTFLAPAVVVGWGGVWLLSREFRAAYPWKKLPALLAAAAAGFVLVPGVILGGFLAAGTTLERLKFCFLDANKAPFEPGRIWFCLALVPVTIFSAGRMTRRPGLINATAAAVFLSVAAYAIALFGFSPELRKQTFLPVYPLAIFFGCRALFAIVRPWRPALVPVAALLVVSGALAHLLAESPPWHDGIKAERDLLRDTLALTQAGDSLLDLKGETIFRRRPVFDVYQTATVRAFDEGRLPEPDPRRLVGQRTAVVIGCNDGFTDEMGAYLKARYLPAVGGNLRVAGRILKPSWSRNGWFARANVTIAGDYVYVRDGVLLGEVHIDAGGPHTFDFGADRAPRLLYWKPAWLAGYPPKPREEKN